MIFSQTKCTHLVTKEWRGHAWLFTYIYIFITTALGYKLSILYHNTTKSIISFLRGVQKKKSLLSLLQVSQNNTNKIENKQTKNAQKTISN